MIPFVQAPAWSLGPVPIQPFGLAVFAAVWVGLTVARRRVSQVGLDPSVVDPLATWVLVGGFLGAHLFAVLAYGPGDVARDPWVLLRVWEHVSSMGGMMGGLAGAAVYLGVRRVPRSERWAILDVVAYSFPAALALGRVGAPSSTITPGASRTCPSR